MGNHKKGAVVARQVTLEPFYHLKVKVVGGLVENKQVGLCEQHVGKGDTLLLTAAELSHRLGEVANLQAGEHLLRLENLLVVALVVETGVENGLLRVEMWRLLQITHTDIPAEDYLAAVVTFLACKD